MKTSLALSADRQEENMGNASVLKKGKTEVAASSASRKVSYDDDESSIQSALFDVAFVLPDDMASEFPLPLVSVEPRRDPLPLSVAVPSSATRYPSNAAADVTLKRRASFSTSIAYPPIVVANAARAPPHLSQAPISHMPKRRKVTAKVSGVGRAPQEVIIPQKAPSSTTLAANGSNAAHPSTVVKTVKTKKGLKAGDRGENTGRWSSDEHHLFLRGLELYGRGQWRKIAALVRTRTSVQVRTHAKKYFIKMAKEAMHQDQVDEVSLTSSISFGSGLATSGNDVQPDVKIGTAVEKFVEAPRVSIPEKHDPASTCPTMGAFSEERRIEEVGLDNEAVSPGQVSQGVIPRPFASIVSLDCRTNSDGFVYSPNPFDVICEANELELKQECEHTGNQRIKGMLKVRTLSYQKSGYAERQAIARRVVASIMDGASGQFLQLDKPNGMYKPLSRELAIVCITNSLDKSLSVANGKEKCTPEGTEAKELQDKACKRGSESNESAIGGTELHQPLSIVVSSPEELEQIRQEFKSEIVQDDYLEAELAAELEDFVREVDLYDIKIIHD
eukprot:CAMPEP_0183704804 /NCGR_PEP_ID=MMETSP0737-20130205/2072_1 /TAXON_ID=385413 /ORGANISM="Thalassiosira miniscula, Strain CCMP1093" /LENGTH=559 /DNA_ID=CAMNT_0025931813 /DNA_START=14 /DNA_END=1693 /DNA_ORIENTATION=+